MAALTVPGTVAGWEAALALSARWQTPLPLARLLEPAIHHATRGFPVTRSQARLAAARWGELRDQPGFAAVFLPDGRAPDEGDIFCQPALGATLARLATAGLRDFYEGHRRGAGRRSGRAGAPVSAADLCAHRVSMPGALSLRLARTGATVWNTRPPTQGIASLMILGIAERLDLGEEGSFAHLHALVEATKRAFLARDRLVGDPAAMTLRPDDLLADAALVRIAALRGPCAPVEPRNQKPDDIQAIGVFRRRSSCTAGVVSATGPASTSSEISSSATARSASPSTRTTSVKSFFAMRAPGVCGRCTSCRSGCRAASGGRACRLPAPVPCRTRSRESCRSGWTSRGTRSVRMTRYRG